MWYWWVFRLQKLYVLVDKKRLGDKIVNECNETIAKEVDIIDDNKNKCYSCIVHIVLFSIFFKINVGIGAYFAYYKYINRNKKDDSRYDHFYQITIY